MLKKIFTLSIIGIFFLGNACAQQSNKNELEDDLCLYEKFTRKFDYENIVRYTHPKYFDEVINRESFLKTRKQNLILKKGLEINMGEFYMPYISPIVQVDNRLFSRVEFASDVEIVFVSPQMKRIFSILQFTFKAKYGAENVLADKENYKIKILTDKVLYAEYLNGRWTFVDSEDQAVEVLEKIIPKKAQEKLLLSLN